MATKAPQLLVFSAFLVFACVNLWAQGVSSFVVNGEAARQRGERSDAERNFKSAIALDERAGDLSAQARANNLLGQISYTWAEYAPAMRYFRQAEKLAVAAKDKREEARAWAFLGQFYWRVGKVEDGEMLLTDALEVFEKTNDEINIALTLRFLGRLENGKAIFPKTIDQGVYSNCKPALDLLERSLAISRKIGDEEGELTTLKEIGLVYQNQDKLPQYLEKAMSYFEPLRIRLKDSNYRRLYAVVLNNIATNQFNAGREFAKVLGRVATAEDIAKLESSIETADEAARIFREIGDRQELREVLDRKVFCFAALGRYSEVLPVVNESIKIAEDLYYQPIGDPLDSSRYFESLIGSYRVKMEVLYKLGLAAEMLETHEAMKSLALRNLMDRHKNHRRRVLSAVDTAEEKRLNDQLNLLNQKLLQTKQADSTDPSVAQLGRQLRTARLAKEEWQANIAFDNERGKQPIRPQNIDISQMCALLPDSNTAFIEYTTNNDFLDATFVLTKDDTDLVPSSPITKLLTHRTDLSDGQVCNLRVFYPKDWLVGDQYNNWAISFRNRSADFRERLAGNSPNYKGNARLLYNDLVADLIPFIKDKKQVVIIPSGSVGNIPFQALINENGRFLIEDLSISYAPSLNALARMRANRLNREDFKFEGDFLAFGNPKLSSEAVANLRSRYRGGQIESLPDAETEVKTIGKFYPKGRTYVGAKATEGVWRSEAPKYRILHLATHGISDGQKPLFSHLLLAGDRADDGLIEAREIADMTLNAEMVVLSACETARGRDINGEGMVGLAWSFAAAGVPSVIASTWNVDSAATADFMVDYYRALNDPADISKSEAIRSSAIKRIGDAKTRHPFYWAGFSLYGDWDH
ncbi:MAG TPA: CHAT domain-containing protein [Pyrinomonadaceae bacterium]|nr:CHAT domain-containing protein [Chloracidobacterium sp.]MBP9934750.1 CHAT domain-containing protein [Pyrinomonadaceae bacterium]MBK9767534.1 CHAT domain-containing protein [Chloracidobacterium sp.]MBL0240990.1 CHAT domain-containing protein [Chloracidobacterium sp.]HQX54673.1 CHAT domain-containing protein [Pyrinomonadaceae bacterium]